MSFTPGPWGVAASIPTMVVTPPSEEARRRIEQGEFPFTARRICICEPSHYTPSDVAEANARLIAAAPDLLAIAEAIEAEEDDGTTEYLWSDEYRAWRNRVKAAIAKAKG